MTFSASYHKGSGGASFSRVGLHGGRGLALALGGWRGKGREVLGKIILKAHENFFFNGQEI